MLLVKELLDNAKPIPELKAICGLVHHNPSISVAVADAVQQHHVFADVKHAPCLLRLVQLVELHSENGPTVNEWATHVLYNMAENSPALAVRLSAAGAEEVLRDLRTGEPQPGGDNAHGGIALSARRAGDLQELRVFASY